MHIVRLYIFIANHETFFQYSMDIPREPSLPHCYVIDINTETRTAQQDSSGRLIVAETSPGNTQQSLQTDIHAPDRIRTRNPY
jgi:hypothetical protein